MGHDHHFLSRLDRVTRGQVDFALSLYRDHQRTAWILTRARLPADAARVALAIEQGPRTPHVIVTRDGHFVTCLGPGMNTGAWPVVARDKLDRLSREHATHVERQNIAEQLERERRAHGTTGSLFDRILYGGPSLGREELLALSAFAPLVTGTYASVLTAEFKALLALVVELAPEFARARKSRTISERWTPHLEQTGWTFWGVQHVAVLYAMHARDLLEEHPQVIEPTAKTLLGLPILGALSGSFVRAAWALANIGGIVLPICKRQWETAQTTVEILSAAAALATLGLRHPELSAEVKKALATPRPEGPAASGAKWAGDLALCAFDPETLEAVREGRSVEQVLDEKLGEWAVSRLCLYDSFRDFGQVVMMLPIVARAEAEHLYLPRELARRNTWNVNDTAWLLARHAAATRQGRPKKPEGPSRSGPCPCGSGKKYKRCCGDTRA